MNGSKLSLECQNRGAEVAPLGIAAKFVTPHQDFIDYNTGEILSVRELSKTEKINAARKIRYELQDVSANILKRFYGKNAPVNAKGYKKEHATCTCNRFKISDTVNVLKSTEFKKSFYTGLTTCANSRTCPVCSAVINERKSNEMRIAASQAEAMNLNMSLLTFTVPHTAGDNVQELVPKILDACRKFFMGKPAERFKEKYGIVGRIRSFEIRVGSNGWHPHFHILIFSNSPLPKTVVKKSSSGSRVIDLSLQDESWLWILERWQNICVRSGLSSPNEYGLDIQDGSEAGEYISKFGGDGEILTTGKGKQITWDMCDEMTKGNVKLGRKGSRSPWDLLSDSVDSSYSDRSRSLFRNQFLDYARAIQGVNIVRWSTGLRKFFGLGKELTDAEIIKKQEDHSELVSRINSDQWKIILKRKHRAYVLQLSELPDLSAFNNYILSLKRGSVLDSRLIDVDNSKSELSSISAQVAISKRDKRLAKQETKDLLKSRNYDLFERDVYSEQKSISSPVNAVDSMTDEFLVSCFS